MELTSSKLYHEARKNMANGVHKDSTSFCEINEVLKLFKLKKFKANAPKMLDNKNFSAFKDATYKG